MAEQGAARPSCDKSRERRDGRATERKARAMHTAARIDRRKEEGKVRVRERRKTTGRRSGRRCEEQHCDKGRTV